MNTYLPNYTENVSSISGIFRLQVLFHTTLFVAQTAEEFCPHCVNFTATCLRDLLPYILKHFTSVSGKKTECVPILTKRNSPKNKNEYTTPSLSI